MPVTGCLGHAKYGVGGCSDPVPHTPEPLLRCQSAKPLLRVRVIAVVFAARNYPQMEIDQVARITSSGCAVSPKFRYTPA